LLKSNRLQPQQPPGLNLPQPPQIRRNNRTRAKQPLKIRTIYRENNRRVTSLIHPSWRRISIIKNIRKMRTTISSIFPARFWNGINEADAGAVGVVSDFLGVGGCTAF
jgi:hypothetical protein